MRALTEWKAFAALAVDYLNMPIEAIPLYSSSTKWSRKGNRVMSFVQESGNFGHNRDNTYYQKYPYFVYKTISFGRLLKDIIRYAVIFPIDSEKILLRRTITGFEWVLKGK